MDRESRMTEMAGAMGREYNAEMVSSGGGMQGLQRASAVCFGVAANYIIELEERVEQLEKRSKQLESQALRDSIDRGAGL